MGFFVFHFIFCWTNFYGRMLIAFRLFAFSLYKRMLWRIHRWTSTILNYLRTKFKWWNWNKSRRWMRPGVKWYVDGAMISLIWSFFVCFVHFQFLNDAGISRVRAMFGSFCEFSSFFLWKWPRIKMEWERGKKTRRTQRSLHFDNSL